MNSWIPGRVARQNARTNANTTPIYSMMQTDSKAHTHTPSEKSNQDMHTPGPGTWPWGDRCPAGHGGGPGALVAPSQCP